MDGPPFGDSVTGAHSLRPYAVQPDLVDASFDIPLRPVKAPVPNPRVPNIARLPPSDPTYEVVNEEASILRGITAAGLIGFASTAITMPLDVAKTLLQVQWIPREDVAVADFEPDSRDFGAEDDELSDEGEAEAYFADLTTRTSLPSSSWTARTQHKRDHAGYIQRKSVFDEATRPEYVLPVVVTGGVWQVIKELVKSKHEGIFSLWKGQLTTFVSDILEGLIRPFMTVLLTSTLAPNISGLSVIESPRPGLSFTLEVASRLATGFLLSPLDLIRTRLIVQASAPRYRKYRGPLHALRALLEEEGGLKGIYLHANLLLPTILNYTVRSLIHLGIPFLLERSFHLNADARPLAYGIADFVLNTAGLLIVLPIEVVRRRLQIQSRARSVTRGKPFRACVETRPVPYAGIVDALYRIVVEETTSVPQQVAARRGRSSRVDMAMEETKSNGLGQLYRGLQVGVAANVLTLVLGLMGERDGL